LKIKINGNPGGPVCELEQAQNLLDFTSKMILVEGRNVRSYDELVQIVTQDKYRDREYFEVTLLLPIGDG
jgi:hypothetical protein